MSEPLLLRLDAQAPDFETRWRAWLGRRRDDAAAVDVADIIAAVRQRGDAALLEYTARWDRWQPRSAADLTVAPERCAAALAGLEPGLRAALQEAADSIAAYHERQRAALFSEPHPGPLSTRMQALDCVGLYVPGGSAAYPSTALMNALPARAAGVGCMVMVSPSPDGRLDESVLAAAAICGVHRVLRIGGAQAIAALAYGTETVPAVDKILGPGNRYVAAAKRALYGQVGLDMPAGPSEVLIIADADADPAWLAADLLAQAEHDPDATSMLVSPDAGLIDATVAEVRRQLPALPRAAIAAQSLRARGVAVRVPELAAATALCNRVAPEHLQLCVADPAALLGAVRSAGAIFLGAHNAEALGDYCAGPSHVLPTGGAARFSSPLGVYDFVRRSSVLDLSPTDCARWAPVAATIARAEGLEAHARAAERRAGALEPAEPAEPAASDVDAAAAARAARWLRASLREETAYVTGAAGGATPATPATPAAGTAAATSATGATSAAGATPAAPGAPGADDVPVSIKLDAMESPHPLPAALGEAWRQRLASVALQRYPDAACADLVAAARVAMGIAEPWGILVGNGSDELIQMLALALAAPGRVLLSPGPSFSMYRRLAVAAGMSYRECPLAEDLSVDGAALRAAMRRHRPALTVIANPNNPTGQLCAPETLRAALREADGPVLVDEAYLAYSGVDSAPLLETFGDRLLLLRTLSKIGLAGLRVGWLIGHRRWTEQLDKLRLPYNVNGLSQAVAALALAHYPQFLSAAQRVVAEREALRGQLDAIAGVHCWPSQANFLLLRVPGAERVARALRAQGTAVKCLHGSHARLDNCLRVTVGTARENAIFLRQLRAALPA